MLTFAPPLTDELAHRMCGAQMRYRALAILCVGVLAFAGAKPALAGIGLLLGLGGSSIIATAGLSVAGSKLRRDAKKIIDRADRFTADVDVRAQERIDQVQEVIRDADNRIQNVLEESAHLVDGTLVRVDEMSNAVIDRIEAILMQADQQLEQINKNLLSAINLAFDRLDLSIYGFSCAMFSNIENAETALRRTIDSINNAEIRASAGGLWLLLGGEATVQIELSDDPSSASRYLPRSTYEMIRNDILAERKRDDITVREIKGIYTDIQHLSGSFRCFQHGGETTAYYVNDFIWAGEQFADWQQISGRR